MENEDVGKSERLRLDGKAKTIRVFTDGAGQRPDGRASGVAWLREDTGEKHTERIDGLTNNVAEYRAVISALKQLPSGSHVELLSDSLPVATNPPGRKGPG